jgi:carbamoyltransferase
MNILGLSGGFGHDAAAALIVDGAVVCACEEERFTRLKRAVRQSPINAVDACLDAAGLTMHDIDAVAFGWDPRLAPGDLRLTTSLEEVRSRLQFKRSVEFIVVPHHQAHAAAAFYTSGLPDAAVLVLDGQGEDASGTVFAARGNSLESRLTFPISDSLGFFYTAVTRYLGFGQGGAGKTMGLAAYGLPTYDFPEFTLSTDGYHITNMDGSKPERMSKWQDRLTSQFGPSPRSSRWFDHRTGVVRTELALARHHVEAAASAQSLMERVIVHLAGVALREAGSQNLVLSGGVALNCSANGRVRQFQDDFFVNGAAHDGGTALGAALIAAQTTSPGAGAALYDDLLLGPKYAYGTAIDRARAVGLSVESPRTNVAEAAARLISRDRVGGWFIGQMEYGPRALGARSIVARADSRSVSSRVNHIKGREAWRPLAPAISSEVADRLGINPKGLDFMIEARWLEDSGPLAGLVHVDDSVRPLLVKSPSHPFSPLLKAMGSLNGDGAIANTSFNVESEPIVASPLDALRTFVGSDLDFLVLGDSLIIKPARA